MGNYILLRKNCRPKNKSQKNKPFLKRYFSWEEKNVFQQQTALLNSINIRKYYVSIA